MAANNMTPQEVIVSSTAELAKVFQPTAGRSFYEFIASGEDANAVVEGANYNIDSMIANKIMQVSTGGTFMSDILQGNATQGASASSASTLAKAINFVINDGLKQSVGSAISSAVLSKTINNVNGVAGTGDANKSNPSIASVIFKSPYLNMSERDTGAVSVFMNGIPSIEFSRCVPYLDIILITPSAPLDSSNRPQGISLFRFLNGHGPIAGAGDQAFVNSFPIELTQLKNKAEAEAVAAGLDPAKSKLSPISFAGMEIFTSPQTLINADEVYRDFSELAESGLTTQPGTNLPFPGMPGSSRSATIIDRMRPFMTLRSFEISVQPTRGTMTTKSAKLSFTLHDRSRLAEISELVKPASFGKTEMMIEWGWSHPDGLTGDNPIGAFLNSLRVKEKYGVYNSSYSFTDDGQVEITVDMVTKGVDSVNWTDVASNSNTRATWKAIEGILESVRTYRTQVMKDEFIKDTAGMSVIATISPTNLADVFSGEKGKEIDEFIQSWSSAAEGSEIKKLVESLNTLNTKVDEQVETLKSALLKKKVSLSNGIDPYFYSNDGTGEKWILPDTQEFISATGVSEDKITEFVSFGKLMQIYVAEPLATNGNFDEVQMCFYTFNDKSGFYGVNHKRTTPLPISCFPVPLKITGKNFETLFDRELKNYIQFPVGRFVNWVNSTFLSSLATPGYGLSKFYSYDETGKTQMETKDDKNAVATLKSEKDRILSLAYYGVAVPAPGQDIMFKMPKVNMIFEVVPVDPATTTAPGSPNERSILRIHFVDAVAGKYAGLGQILSAAKSSNMGVIAKSQDKSVDALKKAGLVEETANKKYYKVIGGPPQIKHFVKKNMPSLTIGTINTAITNASAQSMNDSKDTTIHMLRAQKNAGSPTETPATEQDRGLPMRMMPFDISLDTIGCPLLAHTQQFFIDFGTNTSIDNIYAVCGVEHKMEPGSFTTSVKMIPITDAYGSYESLLSIIDKATSVTGNEGTSPPADS